MLSSIWPWALVAILFFTVLIIFLLVVLLRRASTPSQFVDAKEKPDDEPAAQDAEPPIESGLIVDVPEAFRAAAALLDRSGDGDRYEVPLMMLVGMESSRGAEMLANADLDMTWGNPNESGTALGNGRGFWFFAAGAVLDVAGDYILAEDGKSSDEDGWKNILKQLRGLRPRRPIDGVIVTFSCDELLEAAASEVKRADLAARAGRIFRKLFETQQELGFRLPTYIIVTGCNRLVGFKAFCAAFPDASRREIFGWSSPYGIESAYRGAWIDDGFKTLAGRIEELQMEAFAKPAALDPNRLLRFPPAVNSLLPAVRAALDNLFKSSAYQGTLIFRGLYFVGRENMSEELDEKPSGKVAFLRDVLEKKIFVEHRLASPTTRTIMARNRNVTIAKTCAAAAWSFCIFVLVWAALSFHRQNELLQPLLDETLKSVNAQRSHLVKGEPPSRTESGAAAVKFLNGLSTITFARYDSIFVPVSWISPFQHRIKDVLGASFEGLVLDAMYEELKHKEDVLAPRDEGVIINLPSVPGNAALSAPPASADPAAIVPASLMTNIAPNAIAPLTQVPGTSVVVQGDVSPVWAEGVVVPVKDLKEFGDLHKYVSELKEFDDNARTFSRLEDLDDLHELGKLVKYTFDQELPDSFYDDSEFYKRAVLARGYRDFKVEPEFKQRAATKLGKLFDGFHEALFHKNPFAARLQQLSTSLQQIVWEPPAAGDSEPLAKIDRQLRRIERDLTGADLEWAFRREFNLGPDYAGVLGDISGATILGPRIADQARDATAVRWGRFQQALAWASSPVTKTILSVQQDKPEAHLSNDTLLLKSAIEAFLSQTFVNASPSAARLTTDLPDGKRMEWNGPLLDDAVAVSQSYDRFRSGSLTLFPNELRVSIDQVARDYALAGMFDRLSKAQTVVDASPEFSEDSLRIDLLRFNSEQHSLEAVLDACSRLRSSDASRNVVEAMNAEAYRLLRGVDALLHREQLYRPRQDGFTDWDGKSFAAPAPAVWGQPDVPGLLAYLETTRGRVSFLSTNYAKPALAWLTKIEGVAHPEMRPLMTKWQGISDDLHEYDVKKPGNVVAALEDYIGDRMTKVSLADCSATALQPTFHPNDDFFSTRLQDLSRQLRSRCFAVAGRNALDRYARLEEYFNQRLADHYPFSDHLPRAGEFEADPSDVRTFFKKLDEDKAVIMADADKGGLDLDHDAARMFLNQMKDVREFLSAFVDAPKPEIALAPSIDVEPSFRVLKSKEVEGNEIIGWQFAIGDNSVTNYDNTRKPLRWTAGERPITLSLRWAKDAPRVPVAPPGRGVVRDRTIEWAYNGTWSLLAAFADHPTRAEDLPSHNDDEPVTLAFEVPTVPASGVAAEARPTRVFLRLALLAPDSKSPLKLPKTFPQRAPHFAKEQR